MSPKYSICLLYTSLFPFRLDTVLVGLDYHIGLLYKLEKEEQYFQIFLHPDGTEKEGAFWSSEDSGEPELYTEEEMACLLYTSRCV